MPKVLVTGAAGFIGYHLLSQAAGGWKRSRWAGQPQPVLDPRSRRRGFSQLAPFPHFRFHRLELADADAISRLFEVEKPPLVVNLGAQAGVRYSLENPSVYVQSNVVGFLNVLEACRHNQVQHLVFASSSSVYGANTQMPYSVHQNVDHPVSLYAATKKSNELMAHTYSHLFNLPTTGLRFFTVYGPWGRPDMALFTFAPAKSWKERPLMFTTRAK